jgi:hypothetical protein
MSPAPYGLESISRISKHFKFIECCQPDLCFRQACLHEIVSVAVEYCGVSEGIT